MSHTTMPTFFDLISTTPTPTTVQSSSLLDTFLTPRNVVIAAAIFIAVLMLIIICLIWKFITISSAPKSPTTDKSPKQIEIVVKSKKDKKGNNNTSEKYNRIKSDSVKPTNQVDKILENLNFDVASYASPTPQTVNIIVTPKKSNNISLDNDENFALIAANVQEQEITATKATNGTNGTNGTIIDALNVHIDLESRRSSGQTNVLSEGRRSVQSEGKSKMRLPPVPDKGSILMDIDSIHMVGDGILHENDEKDHSFVSTSNTIDSNTSGSTVKYRLPQKHVTKAHWM
eukprot:183484_1